MSGESRLDSLARWLSTEWSEGQRALFMQYQDWLVDEAIPAGLLGPREGPKIFDRHIADSLAFTALIRQQARTLVDVGSGAGLPGIPIAIARPELEVVLLDRAESRTRLAARVVRMLGIENVVVCTEDAIAAKGCFDVVTFRASLRIGPAMEAFLHLADTDGVGLFAWTRGSRPEEMPEPPVCVTLSVESEGAGVLDSPAWFLRMGRSLRDQE